MCFVGMTSAGTASERAYIGEAEAKRIALAHAGVNEGDIYGYEFEMDYEHGAMIYELEFDCAGSEYEYDINAKTGEIIKFESDRRGSVSPAPTAAPDAATAPASTPTPSSTPKPTANAESGYIGEAKAKQIALAHAGVSEGSISEFECELDREDGIMVYEIDFECGNYEYEYEINAATGEIVKYDIEEE